MKGLRHFLSRAAFHVTRWRWPAFQHLLIRLFIHQYQVDLSDATATDPQAWPTFNAFFTRELRPGARPLPDADDLLVSPADGVVSQMGNILPGGELLQAKSLTYDVATLLGDKEATSTFDGGTFLTIYLAPHNYHRVHLPTDATLTALRHIPGDRFSVNAANTKRIKHLFARNERVALHFRDPHSRPFALVLVGALMVGSIETPWTVQLTSSPATQPPLSNEPRQWHPEEGGMLPRGAEVGRFNMGSTVIALFPPGLVRYWLPEIRPNDPIRCRQAIAHLS